MINNTFGTAINLMSTNSATFNFLIILILNETMVLLCFGENKQERFESKRNPSVFKRGHCVQLIFLPEPWLQRIHSKQL